MMKKILPLFLVAIPTLLFGQKLEVSAFGGLGYTYLNNMPGTLSKMKGNFKPIGSLQISTRFHNSSIGLKGDAYSISSTGELFYSAPNSPFGNRKQAVYTPYAPCINISAIFNQYFRVKDYWLYFGPQIGYALSLKSNNFYNGNTDSYTPQLSIEPDKKYNGVTAGFQFGCSKTIANHLAIKCEVSPRYLWTMNSIEADGKTDKYNALIFPAVFGFAYTF